MNNIKNVLFQSSDRPSGQRQFLFKIGSFFFIFLHLIIVDIFLYFIPCFIGLGQFNLNFKFHSDIIDTCVDLSTVFRYQSLYLELFTTEDSSVRELHRAPSIEFIQTTFKLLLVCR